MPIISMYLLCACIHVMHTIYTQHTHKTVDAVVNVTPSETKRIVSLLKLFSIKKESQSKTTDPLPVVPFIHSPASSLTQKKTTRRQTGVERGEERVRQKPPLTTALHSLHRPGSGFLVLLDKDDIP